VAPAVRVERRIERLLRDKRPGESGPPEVRAIKGLIRRGEAAPAAARAA
jgi:hypothetical protein